LKVLDLVDEIQTLMSKKNLAPQIINCAPGEIHNQTLDSGKAKKLLNWQPEFGLRSGLEETIRWYKTFFLASG
jgi:CDP-glucose 4,6-dehydratase